LARTAAVTLDTNTITRPTGVLQPVATATVLTTSVNPATVRQPVAFTARVTTGTGSVVPVGLVAFTDRSALLGVVALNEDGQAVLTTSTLTVDLHLIVAVYIGAAEFLPSVSATTYQLVQAGPTASDATN
jgi:hypothetical protein